MHIWETKLKNVCETLKIWVKNSYKEPDHSKQELKRELVEIQKDIEDHGMERQKHDKEKWIYTTIIERMKRNG